ncbi:AAA ATPase [Actinomortierella ambigua]|uniref:AAA ATPase n=1 Tax=Actinomortierella ambigua TaxID=1343610 RepID=A0A9P6UCE1_9FUNG|nr:AAA ATPase [Actinomortierella ambigua]
MADDFPKFLRKRAFSISSQDEDFFGGDGDDGLEEDQSTPDGILESPLARKTTTTTSVENITPPRTPTRRSTRQTAAVAAASNDSNGDAPESLMESPPPQSTSSSSSLPRGYTSVPRTPRLTRGMTTPTMGGRRTTNLPLGASSPSTRNNQNSTGLTPSLTRVFKEIKDAENAVPNSNSNKKYGKGNGSTAAEQMKGGSSKGDKQDKTPSYSTPRRLGRTMSGLQGIIPPKAGLVVSGGTLKRSVSSPALAGSSSLTGTAAAVSSLPPPLNYYQEAKSLFRRSAEPHRLIGREAEREVIRTFCRKHMLTAHAGSLYVSGQPGTGKTALLKEIMREMDGEFSAAEHKIQVATVNCMTVKDPRQIYQRVLEEMRFETKTVSDKDKDATTRALETIVLDGGKRKTMYVLILDEIDQLVTKDQDVLYKLFEWTTRDKSRLTLIGIANALDMTDRFLPRLKAKDVEPQLLNFNPYQVADVRNIILDRLFSLEEMFPSGGASTAAAAGVEDIKKPRIPPLMQRPAIELCARKVAAGTGDLRKALDICRQTVEMVEMEYKKKGKLGGGVATSSPLGLSGSSKGLSGSTAPQPPRLVGKMPLQEIDVGELENRGSGRLSLTKSHQNPYQPASTLSPPPSPLLSSTSSSSSSPLSSSSNMGTNPFLAMSLQDAPKVTIAHVNKALAAAFGSPAIQMMRGLNLHQQILLSVLVILLKGGKGGDCTVGKLLDQYTASCKTSNKILAVSKSESQDLINMLEANGLLTVGKAKEERNRKISLVPRESEVVEAVKGQEVVRAMLARAGVAIEG